MAQAFQNNGQRAFEAQNFHRNFGNNFDTVVVSGFSRQIQPRQIVDFFTLKEGPCVCLSTQSNPPSVLLRFSSAIVAKTVVLRYNNVDIHGRRLKVFPSHYLQLNSSGIILPSTQMPPLMRDMAYTLTPNTSSRQTEPLLLSGVRPAVGTSILNLAKAIVLQRADQGNRYFLQAKNQTPSSPRNFSPTRYSPPADQKRIVDKWNPWRPSERRAERVQKDEGKSSLNESCSKKSASSRNEEAVQQEFETENSPKEQLGKRNEKVKGPLVRRKTVRRRSSGKDIVNNGNSITTPQTAVSSATSRLACSAHISMDKTNDTLQQKTLEVSKSERSCSTHNDDDIGIGIKATSDKTVEGCKNKTADGLLEDKTDKNTKKDNLANQSVAGKKERTANVNDNSGRRDDKSTSKGSRLAKGSPKRTSEKKSEEEDNAKKSVSVPNSENKTAMSKSNHEESSKRSSKSAVKGSSIKNNSEGEGLKTGSQTETKRLTVSSANDKPSTKRSSNKVSEEGSERVKDSKSKVNGHQVKGELERRAGQRSTQSLGSEISNVQSDRGREVNQKVDNGSTVENHCLTKKTIEETNTQSSSSGVQRHGYVENKNGPQILPDEGRSCFRNKREKDGDDNSAECKKTECRMKKVSNKSASKDDKLVDTSGEMQEKVKQTKIQKDAPASGTSSSADNKITSSDKREVNDHRKYKKLFQESCSSKKGTAGGHYSTFLRKVRYKNLGRSHDRHSRRFDESHSHRAPSLSLNGNRVREGIIVETSRSSGRMPWGSNCATKSDDNKSRKRSPETNCQLGVLPKKKRSDEKNAGEDCAKSVPRIVVDDFVDANGRNEDVDSTSQTADPVVASRTKMCLDDKTRESSNQTGRKKDITSFKATGLVVAPPTKMCLHDKSEKDGDKMQSKATNNTNNLGPKKVIDTSFKATGLIVAPPRKICLHDNCKERSNDKIGPKSVDVSIDLPNTLNKKRNELSNGNVSGQKTFGGGNAQNGVHCIPSNGESNKTNISSRKDLKNYDSSLMAIPTKQGSSDNLNLPIIGQVSEDALKNYHPTKDCSNKLVNEAVINTSVNDFIGGSVVSSTVLPKNTVENSSTQEKSKRQGLTRTEESGQAKNHDKQQLENSLATNSLSKMSCSKSSNCTNLDKAIITDIMVTDCKTGNESSHVQKLDDYRLTMATKVSAHKRRRISYCTNLDNVELRVNTVCGNSIKDVAKKSYDQMPTTVDSLEQNCNENIDDLAHHKQPMAVDSLKMSMNGNSSPCTKPNIKPNLEKTSSEHSDFLKGENQPEVKESNKILSKQEHCATEKYPTKSETKVLINEESLRMERIISGKDSLEEKEQEPTGKGLSPSTKSHKKGDIILNTDAYSKTSISPSTSFCSIILSNTGENNFGLGNVHSGTINRPNTFEASFTTTDHVQEGKDNNENLEMKLDFTLGVAGSDKIKTANVDQERNPPIGEVQRNTCHVAKVSQGAAAFSTVVSFGANSMVTESDQSEKFDKNTNDYRRTADLPIPTERVAMKVGDKCVSHENSILDSPDSIVRKEQGRMTLWQRCCISDKEHAGNCKTCLKVEQTTQYCNSQGLEMTVNKSSGAPGRSGESCFQISQSSTLITSTQTGSNIEHGKRVNTEKTSPPKNNSEVSLKGLRVANDFAAVLQIPGNKGLNNGSNTKTSENKQQQIRNAQEVLKTFGNELADTDEPRFVTSSSSRKSDEYLVKQGRQDVSKQCQNDVDASSRKILSSSVWLNQKPNECNEQSDGEDILHGPTLCKNSDYSSLLNLPSVETSIEPRPASSSINSTGSKVNLTPVYKQSALEKTQHNEILSNPVLDENNPEVLIVLEESRATDPMPAFQKPTGSNSTNAQTSLQTNVVSCTNSLPVSNLNDDTGNLCLFDASDTLTINYMGVTSQNGELNVQSTVLGRTGKKRRKKNLRRENRLQLNKAAENNIQTGKEIGSNGDVQQLQSEKAGSSREARKKRSELRDSVQNLREKKSRKKLYDPVNRNTSGAVHVALQNGSSGGMKIDGNEPSQSFIDVSIEGNENECRNENGGSSNEENLNCSTTNFQELLTQPCTSRCKKGPIDQGNTVYQGCQDLNDSLKRDGVVIGGKRKRKAEVVGLPVNKERKCQSETQNYNSNDVKSNPMNDQNAASEGVKFGCTARFGQGQERLREPEENFYLLKKIREIKKRYNKESNALLKNVKMLASMNPSLGEKLKGALKVTLEEIGRKFLLELNTLEGKKGEHANDKNYWHDNTNKPQKNYKNLQQTIGKYRKATNGDVLQRKSNCQQNISKLGGHKRNQTKKQKNKSSVVHCQTDNHQAIVGTEPPESRIRHKPKKGKDKTP